MQSATDHQALMFDIDTLINTAQPQSILWIGDSLPDSLSIYQEQKALLAQPIELVHFCADQKQDIMQLEQRFDVAVTVDAIEQWGKSEAVQIISRLRDYLSTQFCISIILNEESWQITELFALGLHKVSSYQIEAGELSLFKYSINDYKKTPDWLNADNWANPEMWGKYWW